MDPGQPFLVVDAPTLSLADFVTGGGFVPVSEWWLSVKPGASADVARQLGAPPYSATQMVSRIVLEQGYQGDPVALAVVGALLLGAIAAVAFGVLGFLVSASAAIEARADEFALLRALGLSDRQLLRWLTIEQALLLAVGVVVGAALGLAFAWIVLPAVGFTPTGAPPVPDPVLEIPWSFVLGLAGGSLVLLAVVVLIARHRLGRISVSATLRAGAD
jgi:ABC-type antimicrobial peptide transport system permease subunit